MNIGLIKQEIVKEFGEWTAHNIQLEDDIYTIDNQVVGDEIKLRRVVQIVSDIAPKPLDSLRILDLACLEGLYAIEFARRGAEVVAIEGRKANIQKACFAKEVHSLSNLELFQDDVRNLSQEKYGYFDVVLCLGILYHLDCLDVFTFLGSISEVCRGFTVIDTHVSLKPEKSCIYNGKEYWGRTFVEYEADPTPEEIEKALWRSLDNLTSFWFTRPSLYNVLSHVGFTSVYECHIPEEVEKPTDRITLLAIKGERAELICCPLMNLEPLRDLPERLHNYTMEKPFGRLHKFSKFIPRQVRELIKKWLYS